MTQSDPARRAVVTGLGAVMPIGNDFPTYWGNLRAGVTGTRSIAASTRRPSRSGSPRRCSTSIRAEFMEPKMARRMSRFIAFAMAAGKEAVTDAGIDFAAMDEDARDRVGVVVNTGGGGLEQVIDGTHIHDTRGPALREPVRRARTVGLDGRLHAVDGVPPDRSGHDPGRRLRDVGDRLPRRPAADPDR